MRRNQRYLSLSLAFVAVVGCSDVAPNPIGPNARTTPPSSDMSTTSGVWNMADVEADFGGLYSLDSTQVGKSATYYLAPVETGDRTFCRDHFNAIDMWWDGGYGLMRFHMDPPLLFVGYREGTYTSPRKLVFRKAVYETMAPSEATDPAGNVWRFEGRYNAICRGGEFELGPLVFGAQIVVAQDPITRPVLIRRGRGDDECGGGGGGGGGGLEEPMMMMTTPSPSATCSGGGVGGGGSVWRCYTVTIDHYYYYPDTGEIEYRYTEYYSWCEQVE